MTAYILTGAPGAGKTAVLRMLETLGYLVVEEAATDVIALEQVLGHDEPWAGDGFIDKIVALQRRRRKAVLAAARSETVFFDRSPICALALARFLNVAVPPALTREIDRLLTAGTYEKTVFFIRNLGFVEPTAARRISLADALAFERLHERVYRELGFDLIDVPAAPLPDRVALICRAVRP
jgi:predicted ATPase